MQETPSPIDRFARALQGRPDLLDAKEQGVLRTYASWLWRHQSERPLRGVPAGVREQCIKDYAWLLMLTRMAPEDEMERTRAELQGLLHAKYPQMRTEAERVSAAA